MMLRRTTTPDDESPNTGSQDTGRRLASNRPISGGKDGRPYDRAFWCAYVANLSIMISVSLLFRYSDFVTLLGGSERHLGWIVGVGTFGSIAIQLAQGAGIDQFGARKIWMVSLVLVGASLAAHLLVRHVEGPMIYAVRILYHCSLGGMIAAQFTYVSQRAPKGRVAEVLGMMGSSGFIGVILGSQLGDVLCSVGPLQRWHLDRVFLAAAFFSLVSLVSVSFSARDVATVVRCRRLPLVWIIRRYHPGRLMVMAIAMGIGVNLPATFLRPFTEHLDIGRIGTFFTTYAVTAFFARLATRRLSQRIGIPTTVILGMSLLCCSMLLYLLVRSPWHLVMPAFAAGFAHALLFPSIVAGGGGTFPARHRGVGMTLILSVCGVGNLVGMPLAGCIVDYAPLMDLPPYRMMFLTMAGLIALATAFYILYPQKIVKKRPVISSPVKSPEPDKETLADMANAIV